MRLTNIIGLKFGRLTVLSRVDDYCYPSGRHDAKYRCECECGKSVEVLGIHLRSGHTTSCGCLRADVARDTMTTHGMSGTRLYNIWKNMLERCTNPNHKNYESYGGRGITVCAEWGDSFEKFRAWAEGNGYSDALTIDRIHVNYGYYPENCRWVTQKTQCNNTRRNIVVNIDGVTHTLKQWTEILGLSYGTIASRVSRGWSPEKALITPVRTSAERK